MEISTPSPEIERLFKQSGDAIRELGILWLDSKFRETDVFRAIHAALVLIGDADLLWRATHSEFDEEMVEQARRRVSEIFARSLASAPSIGEVRLLALREIDERASNMKSLANALTSFPDSDAKLVKAVLSRELTAALSCLRKPGEERVDVEKPEPERTSDVAWKVLLAWESTGRTRKWEHVNELLGHFGLAAESANALRHVWSTSGRGHPRYELAQSWREHTSGDSPANRIRSILRHAQQ